MLIDSPRLTPADRAAWERLERYDQGLSKDPRLEAKAAKAIAVIRDFAAAGPCYFGVSWGKDSVVVADLIARTGLPIPMAWVRVDLWENPDCELVRDAFFEKWPHLLDGYDEIVTSGASERWWDDHDHDGPKRTLRAGFNQAEKKLGARHISGVRAEESSTRRMAQARWGDASAGAARPIGTWTAVDVFAYLHGRGLPVHPAYAMSHGGRLDRRWLRVGSIGGTRALGRGRAEWETAYYGDVITDGRRASATERRGT